MKINLNNIIKEELQKVTNQTFEVELDDTVFQQQIINSGFYNYDKFSKDYDVDIKQSNIFITWHIAFLLNNTGVVKFIPKIDKVEGIYVIEFHDKQTDEILQQTNKNISDVPWKFEIIDATLYLNEGLYIEDLDFDFSNNTCTVGFYDANR